MGLCLLTQCCLAPPNIPLCPCPVTTLGLSRVLTEKRLFGEEAWLTVKPLPTQFLGARPVPRNDAVEMEPAQPICSADMASPIQSLGF